MVLPHGPLTAPGVPRIGLGLAALGRPAYITEGRAGDLPVRRDVDAMQARTHEVLDAAWDAGVRYVDCARSYGLAERFLGSWLAAHSGRREQLVIGSKWGYRYVGDFRMDADVHEVKEHSVAMLDEQWPQTIEALGGPPDVYLVHSATLESPALADPAILARLAELADAGVRVGISTSGPRQGDAIDAALRAGPFSVVQSTWNLLEQSAGPALARAHDAGWLVVIKETLANGRLAAGGDATPALRAAALDGQAPDAFAIGWVLRQPFVDLALSGAVTPEQLASNLTARPPTAPAEEAAASLAEDPEHYWSQRSARPWS
jgi:aryl-alcohol dehydrogenase-like predicted oxidoreductase